MTYAESTGPRFTRVAHGYDPGQVDAHIAALASAEPGLTSAAATALLGRAQEVADSVVAAANVERDQIVRQARQEAADIIDGAQARAGDMIQAAEARVAQLDAHALQLQNRRSETAARVRDLADQLHRAADDAFASLPDR
ncbi:MAG: hypothetical protein ACXVYY_04980 [Oryzihumus sp.]